MAPESVELHVLGLHLAKELPKIMIVWPPDVVSHFVYQCVDEIMIWPKAFRVVRSQLKDNHLTSILVIPKEIHVWIALVFHSLFCLLWTHLCKDADLKVSSLHQFYNAWVGRKLLQQLLRIVWRRCAVLELCLDRIE